MIRRSFLSFIFALLLVFAQQQATVHAYVHTADWQQNSSNEHKSTHHSEACGKCVAHASLGAAVDSQANFLNFASGKFELLTALHQSIISARFCSYRSRAPPTLA